MHNLFIIWLAPWVGKMNRILFCDWLSKHVTWGYVAHLGLPAVSCKKMVSLFHIVNHLLGKLVRSRWLDIGLILFLCVLDFDSVLVNNPIFLASIHTLHMLTLLTEKHLQCSTYLPEGTHLLWYFVIATRSSLFFHWNLRSFSSVHGLALE